MIDEQFIAFGAVVFLCFVILFVNKMNIDTKRSKEKAEKQFPKLGDRIKNNRK